MANLHKLTELLEVITRPQVHFKMSSWFDDPDDKHLIPREFVNEYHEEYQDAYEPYAPDAELLEPNLCGTSACAAGWALALDGQPLALSGSLLVLGEYAGTDDKGKPTYRWHETEDGEIQRKAREILGITENEAYHLFLNLSHSEPLAIAFLAKLIAKYTKAEAEQSLRKEYREDWGLDDPDEDKSVKEDLKRGLRTPK